MAHRVLPDEVKDIYETGLTNTEITVFIQAANIVVTRLLGDSTVLGEDDLREIEKYLTAHFIASTRERQVKSETIDGAKIDFGAALGKGLDGTTYGQIVKLLDTSGVFATDVEKKSVQLFAITSFE